MKFTTTTVLAASAALVSASPIGADTKPSGTDTFQLMALRTGTPLQFASIQAVAGGLRVAGKQNSTCSEPDVNYASFQLSPNGDLALYTSNPPIKAYVDRSGMGQGVLGFTTGVQPLGRNSERGPFKIDDESNLVFAASNGVVGFQGCPVNGGKDGYSIWLAVVDKPAAQEGCIPFTARALKEEKPVKCSYNDMDRS